MRGVLPEDSILDFVSTIGGDPFSRRQIAFLADNRIGIANSPILAGLRPGIYAITLDGYERSFDY
jgi:2-dehydro-3-deoxygluconokinase